MAADEEKNRQNQQAGESHLDQKNAPNGIPDSWSGDAIMDTGRPLPPDEHDQSRTEKLARKIADKIVLMHLSLQPERQRDSEVEMGTVQLAKRRDCHERSAAREQQSRNQPTRAAIGKHDCQW